jgi:phage N-6-adenine-methyltransferase
VSAPGPARAVAVGSRSDWETPPQFFAWQHSLWQFEVDAAANERNHKLAAWFGPGGLSESAFNIRWRDFGRNFWVNPPYGRGLADWIALFDQQSRDAVRVVALLPANTDTQWWMRCVHTAQEITLLTPRIGFWRDGKPLPPKEDANPGGSMLVRWEPFGSARGAHIRTADWRNESARWS